jgi:hypothetical protein
MASTEETSNNDLAQRGIALCRKGDWQRGLELLAMVADQKDAGAELPGTFYTYLGYGIARYDRRVREGLALCEHGVKREFYQPDNYFNLARTYLLANQRRKAIETVIAGRQVDRRHPGLGKLHKELGIRRPPVLAFLSRDHFLNRLLGRMRHDWRSSPKTASNED